ncbi:AMP-binding protein [Glaciimonas sp. PAMC28666]|uniref:AMP-binding protein n=1 Tax=Glaciimonas sp. PAMC28666 TaxID=2807626 RepID=UPI00351C4803
MSDFIDLLSLLSGPVVSDIAIPHSERPFAWRDGERLDRAYFLARVDEWRTVFLQTPGASFALYLSDCAEFSCALFGAWQADKIIYLPGDILPATCAALTTVVDGFVGDFSERYLPLTLPKTTQANVNVDDLLDPRQFSHYVHAADRYDFKPLSPDFPGLVIYTSGSTGEPQAVVKKLSQLSTEITTLEALFGHVIGGGADVIATVSHQHIYGLLFKVLWPLTAGRPIHAQQIAFLEELRPLLRRIADRPAILVSSPAHLKRIPASMQPESLHALQAVFSSGGPLSEEVAQAAGQHLGHVPIEVYGSSETGGVGWRQRSFDRSIRASAHSHAQRDESWNVMPAITWRIGLTDSVLEIRSPHLPDDAWFSLADQAQATDENHFVLTGRIDRIVKVEEKRISLNLIEGQLKASGLVADARVLLMDDGPHQRRQKIAAFIVLNDAGRLILAEQGKLSLNRRLRESIAHAIEPIALPRSWHYLVKFPVNAQGKTTRADLLSSAGEVENSLPLNLPVTQRITKPNVRLLDRDMAASRVSLELTVPPDLLYFKGHFDGSPILPGVAQVDWAIAYGREYLPLAPCFLSMHALKFQRVVMPGAVLQLTLMHDVQKSSLTFSITSDEGQHASGRILFGLAPAAEVQRHNSDLISKTQRQVGNSENNLRQQPGTTIASLDKSTPITHGDNMGFHKNESNITGFNPCAVIPVFNHAHAIGSVVAAILSHRLPCILVDDGSSTDCAAVLDALAMAHPGQITLLRHAANLGKGGAVVTGVCHAAQTGYTHALQIDADGQHCTDDIPLFLAQAAARPEALIAGVPQYDDSVPKVRFYARYLTHVMVWINTLSLDIKDSMCGFRVYPLAPFVALVHRRTIGQHMDFDTDVIVRLYWEGMQIINFPTRVGYPSDGVSHFRMVLDNLLISRMHATLFVGMLLRAPTLLVRKFSHRRGRK